METRDAPALAAICYYLQNGQCFYGDIHGEQIEGIERFRRLCDIDHPLPVSSCYAGMLILQAMGLGGWMYDSIDPCSVLGASGNPEVPGLGFRYDTDGRWPPPIPPAFPASLRATPRRTTGSCAVLSTLQRNESSGAAAPSTPELRAPPTGTGGCGGVRTGIR